MDQLISERHAKAQERIVTLLWVIIILLIIISATVGLIAGRQFSHRSSQFTYGTDESAIKLHDFIRAHRIESAISEGLPGPKPLGNNP